jgi:Peptidase A4 family/IPT/TIG domain
MRAHQSIVGRSTATVLRLGLVCLVVVGGLEFGQTHASASSPATANRTATSRLIETKPATDSVRAPSLPSIRPLSPRGVRTVGSSALPASPAPRIVGAGAPGPSPIHRIAGPTPHLANQSATFSTNWSGQVLFGGTYTGVGAQWSVPAVVPAGPAESSASWIGIDGIAGSSLIQTGTTQETAGSTTDYFAWFELLPNSAIEINGVVQPGDQILAAISETSTDVWTLSIEDATQNWIFSQPFNYSTPGLSAEWIEEAPTINGSVATLANFGKTTFTDMQAGYSSFGSSLLYPVYMTSADGNAIIAYPDVFDPASNSFTDVYGTPPPVVNSITPNQGTTGTGTGVEIDGEFLSGAEHVDFGQVGVAFSVNYDGSISAIAPPDGSGTMDVTVTTPGGTSATTPADQFTYAAPAPPPPAPPPPPAVAAPAATSSQHGYWLVGGDGGIFTFGSARFHGSTGHLRLQRPVVGITPTADHTGYWLVASDGGVFAFGDAGFHGSIPGLGYAPAGAHGAAHPLNASVVGIVPTANGDGYFMVASDGGVFAFGDAKFEGSCPGISGCSGPAVAVMPDASGKGYWLVTATGGVYSFGDAPFYGAPGPVGIVTSSVRTPDGKGYWILFSDGTIAAFGDAARLSDLPGIAGGSNPATAIFATSDGGGYWMATARGSVYRFGDAPNDGGVSGLHLNAPIVAAVGW